MIAINMKMPSCCAECPMYQSEDSDYCDITGEWITGEEMVRHKNCPLVEIVTCEECEYWHDDGIMTTCDKKIGHGFPRDHFCPDGKRKEPRDFDDTFVNDLPRSEEYFEERTTGNPDFCNG